MIFWGILITGWVQVVLPLSGSGSNFTILPTKKEDI